MNFNSAVLRAALTLAGVCGVVALQSAQAAGTVSSDSTGSQATLCSTYTNVNMTPAGDLQIVGCVAASSSGGPTAAPACSVSPSVANINTGGSTTLTASCNQGPLTGFQWVATDGGPLAASTTTQSQNITFPANGTFHYTVSASNSLFGMGAASAAGTVNVTTASTGGGTPPAGCPAYSQAVAMPNIGAQQQVSIPWNGQLAGLMPNMAPDGLTHSVTIAPTQVNQQSTSLTVQLAISKCPGDFPNVINACSKWGSVYQGAMRLYASYVPALTGSTAICEMKEGDQYYLNMRWIGYDSTNKVLTGPSRGCTGGTCSMWITGSINN